MHTRFRNLQVQLYGLLGVYDRVGRTSQGWAASQSEVTQTWTPKGLASTAGNTHVRRTSNSVSFSLLVCVVCVFCRERGWGLALFAKCRVYFLVVDATLVVVVDYCCCRCHRLPREELEVNGVDIRGCAGHRAY